MREARKIFDPFQRLQHEKDYEGIGIGLANVRKIIQKHGGQIWFQSAPDQGASFYFSLARAQHDGSSIARDGERVSPGKPVSPHHAGGPARFSIRLEPAEQSH